MQFRFRHPWDPGYALPTHVMAEPPGRGTLTTGYIPRKTYDDAATWSQWDGGYAVPKYIKGEPRGRGAVMSKDARRRAFQTPIPQYLGDDASDALKAFGDRAADYILSTLPRVPLAERATALEVVFRTMDPGLMGRVSQNLKAGMSPRDAISAGMQAGLGQELVRIGQGQKPALGYFGGQEDLAGLWDVIKWPFEKIGSAAKKVGTTAWNWGGDVLSFTGKLACGVTSSSIGTAVGGGAAVAAGAPPQVGVTGALVTKSICQSGQSAPPPVVVQSTTPSWLVPAAIGGGALLLVVLLTRK